MADSLPRKKARNLAKVRRLAGLANDTKWSEFFSAIQRLGIPLQVKLLYEMEPFGSTPIWVAAANYIDSIHGPELFVFVEWVRASAVEAVSGIASAAGLEYSVEDAEITVYGYK